MARKKPKGRTIRKDQTASFAARMAAEAFPPGSLTIQKPDVKETAAGFDVSYRFIYEGGSMLKLIAVFLFHELTAAAARGMMPKKWEDVYDVLLRFYKFPARTIYNELAKIVLMPFGPPDEAEAPPVVEALIGRSYQDGVTEGRRQALAIPRGTAGEAERNALAYETGVAEGRRVAMASLSLAVETAKMEGRGEGAVDVVTLLTDCLKADKAVGNLEGAEYTERMNAEMDRLAAERKAGANEVVQAVFKGAGLTPQAHQSLYAEAQARNGGPLPAESVSDDLESEGGIAWQGSEDNRPAGIRSNPFREWARGLVNLTLETIGRHTVPTVEWVDKLIDEAGPLGDGATGKVWKPEDANEALKPAEAAGGNTPATTTAAFVGPVSVPTFGIDPAKPGAEFVSGSFVLRPDDAERVRRIIADLNTTSPRINSARLAAFEWDGEDSFELLAELCEVFEVNYFRYGGGEFGRVKNVAKDGEGEDRFQVRMLGYYADGADVDEPLFLVCSAAVGDEILSALKEQWNKEPENHRNPNDLDGLRVDVWASTWNSVEPDGRPVFEGVQGWEEDGFEGPLGSPATVKGAERMPPETLPAEFAKCIKCGAIIPLGMAGMACYDCESEDDLIQD